ncbi:MAG: S8 family serine peptidase [Acidobacteriota bacterium]|jgi:hypothetical protein
MRRFLCSLMLAVLPAAAVTAAPAPVAPWVEKRLEADGAADVLVLLRERPDLAAAREQPTRRARARFVFDALTRAAERSQAGLRAFLDARGVPYRAHYLGNLIRLRADEGLLRSLARRPEVERIVGDPRVPLRLPAPDAGTGVPAGSLLEATEGIEWNVERVNAPALWAQGYTGQGVVVGIQDTGIAWDHPAILDQYAGWDGSTASHDYHWHDAIAPNAVPLDDHGHGTHVTGTAVGDDGGSNQIGVAPGARWIGCRNMLLGVGTPGSYTECFEFLLAPYPFGGDPVLDGDPDRGADVISNSWSCPPSEGCDPGTLASIVAQVRAAGILVVAAAQNAGPSCSTVQDPIGIYDEAFTIGATDSSDNIAGFSSRGPVLSDGSGRRKPDVAAPGVAIRSCLPGGTYQSWNGTSMATPHVAGVAALLLSAIPALAGQPGRIEDLIIAGARPRQAPFACGLEPQGAVPNNTFGHGIVDAAASLAADPDLDGLASAADNCPGTSNPAQGDGDADGTGDACDCAPGDPDQSALPGEAVLWMSASDPDDLQWSPMAGVGSYQVYTASRPDLTGPSMDFACLASGLAGTSFPTTAGGIGDAELFLVTATNCFGPGPAGAGTASARNLSPACP